MDLTADEMKGDVAYAEYDIQEASYELLQCGYFCGRRPQPTEDYYQPSSEIGYLLLGKGRFHSRLVLFRTSGANHDVPAGFKLFGTQFASFASSRGRAHRVLCGQDILVPWPSESVSE